MPDYGHEIEFGLFPTPNAANHQHVVELTALADTLGLDVVSIQDHPYQRNYLDTWTLLSYLGALTTQVRLSPNVISLPLRQPAVLAKSAASLDVLTNGRVELGLGAGAFWDPIVAAGGPRRSPGEAVTALEEAIEILRQSWTGGTVRVRGEHYQVEGLQAGPKPVYDIPIWLGAYKPRMLRLTGRLADAWVPSMGYADPPALPDLNAAIDEAADKAGRGPVAIKRLYNIFGQFGSGSGFLKGTPANWAEQLADLALEQGMSTFILGSDDPDMIRAYANDVAPAVRELVEEERARRAANPDSTQSIVTAEPAEAEVRGGERRETHTEQSTEGNPAGQHLVDIHNGLRAELTQLRDILAQVRDGHASVGQARSVINTMTMRQNNWTLGGYCQAYCRILTGHHTLEDASIFPHLRRSEPALAPVIDRLEAEHDEVHGLIEGVDRALVELVGSDGVGVAGREALDGLQRAVDALTETLLDHLAYEERELIGPLGRHGFA